MRKYPLLYGVGLVALLATLGGVFWFPKAAPAQKNISHSVSSYSDPDLELVVTSFLNQLVQGHIQDAQAYTTGDTKKVLASNQAQSKDLYGSLVNKTLTIRYENQQVAQVEVDAIVQAGEQKNRSHSLYSLIKEGQWKIYKIESLPLAMSQDEGKEFQVPSVISDYLETVSKGNWQDSTDNLTGQALQDVQKTMRFLPKHFISPMRGLKQTPVMVNQDKAMILAEYDLIHPDQKKSHLKTMFWIEKVDTDWKISQITNVEEKDE